MAAKRRVNKTVRPASWDGFEIAHRPGHKGLWYHLLAKGMGPRVKWYKTHTGMNDALQCWQHSQIKRDPPRGWRSPWGKED
jgi:hypothetical protein